MTETEFNTCTDPRSMLDFLRGRASHRKLRLFAVACCRRIWHLLIHPVSRKAVEVAERFADRAVTVEERRKTHDAAEEVGCCLADSYWSKPLDPNNEFDNLVLAAGVHLGAISGAAAAATAAVADVTGEASILTAWNYAWEAAAWSNVSPDGDYEDAQDGHAERTAQAALLRELFGPLPFRAVRSDASWLTPAVVALANSIYEERRWGDLRILGDALQEAGCSDAEVLEHCRGKGPHTKGCWVCDLLLKKE